MSDPNVVSDFCGYSFLSALRDSPISHFKILVNSGSTKEDPSIFGCAHFLEHMAFKGTKTRSYKEINRLTSELGLINACTDYERIAYHFTFLRSDYEQAIGLLLEMFFEPSFNVEEFEKEKGVICEEIQTRLDDPWLFFWTEIIPKFLGEKMGHEIAGTQDLVRSMSVDDLIGFRELSFKKEDITFIFVGPDPGEIEIFLKEELQKYNSIFEEKRTLPFSSVPNLNEGSSFHFNHKSKQAVFAFGLQSTPGYEVAENDMPSIDHMTAACLGGGMHSLLFDRLREELGLCYSTGAFVQRFNQMSMFTMYCLLSEENIEKARGEMLKILKQMREHGVDDELLKISKKNRIFKFWSGCQTASGFSGSIFDSYYKYGRRIVTPDEIIQKTNDVTNDHIIEFAREHFTDEGMTFFQMTQEK